MTTTGKLNAGLRGELRRAEPLARYTSSRVVGPAACLCRPAALPSYGSVFRNPPGEPTARLIDADGMKGLRFGTAEVSPKHSNFIIDTGNASASARLIDDVQAEVERLSGIRLIPEVLRVGAFSS